MELEGIELARAEEQAPVWSVDGALKIGDAQSGFAGAIDALVISAVSAGAEVRLPEGVRFAPDVPKEIRFDSGGNLEREVHADPVVIGLVYQDGTTATVRVGLYGTVE